MALLHGVLKLQSCDTVRSFGKKFYSIGLQSRDKCRVTAQEHKKI